MPHWRWAPADAVRRAGSGIFRGELAGCRNAAKREKMTLLMQAGLCPMSFLSSAGPKAYPRKFSWTVEPLPKSGSEQRIKDTAYARLLGPPACQPRALLG
jgi:hypothetical protein